VPDIRTKLEQAVGRIRHRGRLSWALPVAVAVVAGAAFALDQAWLQADADDSGSDAVHVSGWVLPYRSEPKVLEAGTPRRLALNPEQYNVARYIASHYRIASDAAGEFVYHAYRAASEHDLDPLLILAVMSVESSFNPAAQSHKGAQGLMQVLTRVHAERFMPFGGITAAFDPVANIRVGAAILREYLDREGSIEGALKSYVGAALLSHDRGYGAKVLRERERFAMAAAGVRNPANADA
jgi:soluble lytic murein transglycosylase-like protein